MRLVNVIKKHYIHTLHSHILIFELNQYHDENYTILWYYSIRYYNLKAKPITIVNYYLLMIITYKWYILVNFQLGIISKKCINACK